MTVEKATEYRLLIVDDNKAIHQDIISILNPQTGEIDGLDLMEAAIFDTAPSEVSRESFKIQSAFQGKDGLAFVEQAMKDDKPFSIAFVDVRMPPGWDGIETITKIWEVDPDIQIVLCTGYTDYSWKEIDEHVDNRDSMLILKKPFDPIEVLQVCHALTSKWCLHQELRRRMDNLELEVKRRTEDLQHNNAKLKKEISTRLKAENDLRHIATHDALTNLPNRVLLRDRFDLLMAHAKRNGNNMAALLIDVDHFKRVNDTLGHDAGDRLLQQVAEKLSRCIRAVDTVARMGGDEFVILLGELDLPDAAEYVCKRIISEFEQSFELDGHKLHVTTSIGVGVYPKDASDAEGILKAADIALYYVKDNGRSNYHFYNKEEDSSSSQRLMLSSQLHGVAERGELSLCYQPLVNLATGEVLSFEALVRWQHPTLGELEPMSFISLAEEIGEIIPIGRWVIKEACRQNKAWQDAGLPAVPVAVNVSSMQLPDPGLISLVKDTLEQTGLDPCYLDLELTESAAMKNFNESKIVLQKLSNLGVKLVIDDFGSGYSSLIRLRMLPISTVKIDRFFIHNIVQDPQNAMIVGAIVALAHSLDMKVVAEGIETEEQLEFLKNADWNVDLSSRCDILQGFLFSKPLLPDSIAACASGADLSKLLGVGSKIADK